MVDKGQAVEDNTNAAEDAANEKNEPAAHVHILPSGEALTGSEAFSTTRAQPARVVVIAGPAESGKTTFLACLYEQFHFRTFGGYLFAASRTLIGFEKRCHLARRASGRETPDTERTRRSDRSEMQPLLHLAVRRIGAPSACDLLFTDIYGEAFRLAADSTEDCQRLDVLRRADYVAILIDGKKLVDLRHRQEAFTSAEALLRSSLDAGMMDQTSQVQLLLSKWDLVLPALTDSQRKEFIEAKKARLLDRYSSRVASLECFEVAARPEAGSSLKSAHGLDNLLDLWVRRPRQFRAAIVTDPYTISSGEFDRFARLSQIAVEPQGCD